MSRPAPSAAAEPAVPLVEELARAPSPFEAARRLASRPHLLLLDSADASSPWSRYSFVTADPFAWAAGTGAADPFPRLASLLAPCRAVTVPGLPPFQGGAAGLWAYDLNRHLERLPRPRHDEFRLPNLAVGLYDWVLAYDHAAGRAWLITTGLPAPDPAARRRRAEDRLRTARAWLAGPPTDLPLLPGPVLAREGLAPQYPVPLGTGLTSTFSPNTYRAAVRRAVEYVHAGDCFQVNLAQRLLTPLTGSPLALYARLRERNAAPFAGLLHTGDAVVASASPERFLRVRNGHVDTFPIKGTRRRGATPREDLALVTDLQASEKDRAENVMIVDLMRNDLGRVCRYGSVRVPAVCRLETFRYVHHLISEVVGDLRDGLTPLDLLRAAFPGGSVTGAPKVRAMEIIVELEPTARGPYCGCLGYLGFDGSMDTSILIRTFTAARGWLQFPVGGGIVADSDPAHEYEETLHKAEGLVRALE